MINYTTSYQKYSLGLSDPAFQLNVDLSNANNGYVLCLNYFNSGVNKLHLTLSNSTSSLEVQIMSYDCKSQPMSICRVMVKTLGGGNVLQPIAKTERTNRWLFLCLAFDLLNQTMSAGLHNKLVMASRAFSPIAGLSGIRIWWKQDFKNDYVFSEKLTLFDIHSVHGKSVEDFQCGEAGDLYAWKATNWLDGNNNSIDSKYISQETTLQTCKDESYDVLMPLLSFPKAQSTCQYINGYLYGNSDDDFVELTVLEGEKNRYNVAFWYPFKKVKSQEIFKNIYNNRTFEGQLRDNGRVHDECLAWETSTHSSFIEFCGLDTLSYCRLPKDQPYLQFKGLCPGSKLDRYYTASMDKDRFVWKGASYATIQYTDHWVLHSLTSQVWAESDAPFNSLLIGTHAWTIHNDRDCASAKPYSANLSLRLVLFLACHI